MDGQINQMLHEASFIRLLTSCSNYLLKVPLNNIALVASYLEDGHFSAMAAIVAGSYAVKHLYLDFN